MIVVSTRGEGGNWLVMRGNRGKYFLPIPIWWILFLPFVFNIFRILFRVSCSFNFLGIPSFLIQSLTPLKGRLMEPPLQEAPTIIKEPPQLHLWYRNRVVLTAITPSNLSGRGDQSGRPLRQAWASKSGGGGDSSGWIKFPSLISWISPFSQFQRKKRRSEWRVACSDWSGKPPQITRFYWRGINSVSCLSPPQMMLHSATHHKGSIVVDGRKKGRTGWPQEVWSNALKPEPQWSRSSWFFSAEILIYSWLAPDWLEDIARRFVAQRNADKIG